MSLPLFYHAELNTGDNEFELSEENTRHIISVLRMKKGDMISLTDGKGLSLKAEIEKVHKNHTRVIEKERNAVDSPARKLSLGVSLIKNAGRFEWFLEKATEIGITEILPMICERTEKEKFRMERMRGICISAMIQSKQVWMPLLAEPVSFQSVIEKHTAFDKKFIAHCLDENKTSLSANLQGSYQSAICLIGPEGDFTNAEIKLAIEKNFSPVTLGETRLRTETAAVAAAVLMRLVIPL